jgi:hypothetical protein
MVSKTSTFMLNCFFIWFLIWIPFALAETHLQYQDRGNRHEGIKAKPVAGYDIELISLRVVYMEEIKKMPDQYKIKFYLCQPSKVHITVRELDYRYYYWMDKVQPSSPWRSGFGNVFNWPTQVVIQQLGNISMYDLGVVARLERPEPGRIERVAPVILFHSQFPEIIKGYLFTFKTYGDARLSCSVYKKNQPETVFQVSRKPRGGRPFTVRWNSAQSKEGFYRLLLRGYFLDSNDPIEQMVHFYHRPYVQ